MVQPEKPKSRSPLSGSNRRRERANNEREGYAKNLVQQEAAQSFERARAVALCQGESVESNSSQSSSPSSSADQRITGMRLYRSWSQSSATPMERFVTISTANEPFGLLARTNMRHMQLDVGSLETLEVRVRAARQVAGEVENMSSHYRGGVMSSPTVILHPSGADADAELQRQRQRQNVLHQRTRREKRDASSNKGSRSPKRHQPRE